MPVDGADHPFVTKAQFESSCLQSQISEREIVDRQPGLMDVHIFGVSAGACGRAIRGKGTKAAAVLKLDEGMSSGINIGGDLNRVRISVKRGRRK